MAVVPRVKKAEVYPMTPSVPRIIEAILHIVSVAEQRREPVTQYDVVKTLFLADRINLNRRGRPITYDNYVALKHGPVPSFAYDLLKQNAHSLRKHHISATDLPWSRRSAPELGDGCYSFEAPRRQADEDILSPSDTKELSESLTVVKALGFRQVRRLTHEDQAYVDAWEDDADKQQFPMSYTLMFDVPNVERAKEIAFLSQYL